MQVLNLSSVANWLGEKLEDRDGFVPKTMLSLPIYNGQRDVIGVAQLINKVTAVFKCARDTLGYWRPLLKYDYLMFIINYTTQCK